MELARVDAAAAEIVAAYELFLTALSGRYLGLRAAGVGSAAMMKEIQLSGYRFARSFLDIAAARVREYPAVDDGGALSEALAARGDALIALFKSAVVRNIKQAEGWAVQGQAPTDPFTQPSGAVGLLWQQKMAAPQFTLPDAIGRNWSAATLLGQSARDAFYQAELEATVALARKGGYLFVRVLHPTAHEKNGMVLSLAVGGSLPFIDDPVVRQKLFHPNALATVEPYDRVSP